MNLVLLALGLSTLSVKAQTSYPPETFDSWPSEGWGTYTNSGWVIHDGKTQGSPLVPPYSSPIAVWFRDYDYGTNSWLSTDWLANGVGRVQFRAENYSYSPGVACSMVIEYTTNGTHWAIGDTLTHTTIAGSLWPQYSVAVGTYAPTRVRWRKTGESPAAAYVELGLDNVEITAPAAISLGAVTLDPPSPTSTDTVDVSIQVPGVHSTASNLTIRLYYRLGGWGPYLSREMAPLSGSEWRTVAPIPAGGYGLLEYYVVATAELGGLLDTIMVPNTAPAVPLSVTITGTAPTADRRQLAPSSRRTSLNISEIMYNPAINPDGYDLEYIEIYNTDPVTNDVSGFRLSGQVDFTFPENTLIPPRSCLVVAANPAHFSMVYPGTAFGPYQGSLSNGGGMIRLRDPNGDTIVLEVNYDNNPPWPIGADGAGHSLVLTCPDYGEDDVRAWSQSVYIGGSPGYALSAPEDGLDNLQINEFLAHTDLPQIDFIELHNYGTIPLDATGCILTDNPTTNKYTITNGIVAANGFLVFDQHQLGFSLSMSGDDIYLLNPDGTRILDAVRFEAQTNGLSTGRWPDGAGDFHPLNTVTPGSANRTTSMHVSDVVINEIMFHPISNNSDDEYVELHNRGLSDIDIGYWRFTDGIDYMFQPGTTIPAGGYLVVAKNQANLLARYPQLNTNNLVGNFSGQLSDSGERIALSKPDDLALPYQDYVVVDEVTYSDGWDHWIDGDGSSLELIDARADNRWGMNWAGSDETQKSEWTTIEHTDVLNIGADSGSSINEVLATLTQEGECLLDDVEISVQGSGVVFSDDFESGIGNWTVANGNHIRSTHEPAEGYGGGASFHIRASGKGFLRFSNNHEVFRDNFNQAAANLGASIPAGATCTIRYRARWLAGWPYFAMVLKGAWHEAAGAMPIPPNLGTPGQPNSRAVANAGPAIRHTSHSPVLPAANEAVLITCEATDPDGISAINLRYRLDPGTTTSTVAMKDDGTGSDVIAGDGIFSATLPGQSAGTLVAFTIRAIDAAGTAAESQFPAPPLTGMAPDEALVRFGDTALGNAFGSYSIWMTAATRTELTTRHSRSNEPLGITFVYDDARAIYTADMRYRGGWRLYASGGPETRGAYAITIPKDQRVQGAPELRLDNPGQSQWILDPTKMRERQCFWAARQLGLPISHLRYVHVKINGVARGLLHEMHVPAEDFVNSMHPSDDNPQIFKMNGAVPKNPNGLGNALTTDGNKKTSMYRWAWLKKKPNIPDDDFSPVYPLVDALAETDDYLYYKRSSALMDEEICLGYLAANHIVQNEDSFGAGGPHNMIGYFPPHKPAEFYLYDMDFTLDDGDTGKSLIQATDNVTIRMEAYPAFQRIMWRHAKNTVYGPFVATKSDAHIDAWYAAMLNDGVAIDPAEITKLKNWIAQRRTSLLSQLGPREAPLAITLNGGSNFETANRIITLTGTAPVELQKLRLNGEAVDVDFSTVTGWSLDVALEPGANTLTIDGVLNDGSVAPVAPREITVTYTGNAVSPAGHLVINEIMYNSSDDWGDFIEIHNTSAHRLDLGGMRINGVDFTFPTPSLIDPDGYLVVAENLPAYQRVYGNAEVVAGEYDGSLDNGGETLSLWMPASPATPDAFSTVDDTSTNWWVVIDSVRYDDDAPWPTEADGFGPSLQLVDASRDNSRPGNWASTPSSIEAKWIKVSVTVTPPAVPWMFKPGLHLYLDGAGSVLIDDISLVDESNPGVNLVANGDFESPLSGTWTLGTGYDGSVIHTGAAHGGSQCLQLVGTQAGSPTLFLPASVYQSMTLTAGTSYTLSFWYLQTHADLTVTLERPGTTLTASQWVFFDPAPGIVSTPGAPNNVIDSLPPFPELWINEIMPSNVVTRYDSANEFDPWIELYNSGATPIDLGSGYYLSNDPHDTTLWTFPAGWSIGAGERLLVWADAQPLQTANYTELHAGFRLDGHTGTVVLAYDTGSQARVLDSIDYAFVGADYSYGSATEGDPGSRVIFHYPTPGASNSIVSQPVQLTINEWMADNVSTLNDPADLPDLDYEDWFEIHNAGSTAVNLGGYTLTDDLSAPAQYTVPNGTYVPAGGFLLVWADGETGQNGATGDLHVNFKLSAANGESIGLFAPDGSLVDAVTFGPQLTDISEGRWRDGASFITQMGPPTPRAANRVLMVTGVQKAGGGMTLTWSAAPGTVYRIEAHSNLVETSPWTPMGLVTAQTGVAVFTDQATPAPHRRFYRIIIE